MSKHLDREWLEEKYIEDGLSAPEIADICGVVPQTIYYAMDKFGVERDSTRYGSKSREEYATFYTTIRGYERWVSKHREGGERVTKSVMVHQLFAVAEGADPHEVFSDDTNIHHRNGIPWMNVSGNIQVVRVGEHMTHHRSTSPSLF